MKPLQESVVQEQLEQIKIGLLKAVRARVRQMGLSQKAACQLMRVGQARISTLLHERANLFGIVGLLTMAIRAGLVVEIKIGRRHKDLQAKKRN